METRSNRRGLLQFYVSSQWPDLPAIFESLNDDTLTTILRFVGRKSYRSFGGVNKRCKEVYLATKGMTKETFLYGYGPLSRITDRIEIVGSDYWKFLKAVGKGVVYHNRRDVMDWALQQRNKFTSKGICNIAVEEERFDILVEVFNSVGDWSEKEDIFEYLYLAAVHYGKLNVLKWLCTKGLSIDKEDFARAAAFRGRIHILQWLREERGLELNDGELYEFAIKGGKLHVMKWLRKQGCPWVEDTFPFTAEEGNLNILQWLHDEGCPWPYEDDEYDYRVNERELKPVVVDWLRVNGYGDRIQ